MGSFLNSDTPLPFDMNEFYRESPPPVDQSSSSIQVVYGEDQMQSSAPISDFYNSLMPSKLSDSYNPEMSFGNYQSSQPPPPPSGPSPMNAYTPSASFMAAPPPPPSSYNPQHMEYSPSVIPMPSQQPVNDDYSWNRWNANPVETPHSPPHFERKGHDRNAVEYIDDSLRPINDANDVDHRQASNGLLKGPLV